MAKLLVGLGNIGKEYERTVHNLGFMVLDKVADEINVQIKKNICSSLVGEINYKGEKVVLAKPTTYMNNSGIAVKSLVKKFNIDISKDLLIINDDIDLPQGVVRLREKGSAGTHNGLKSIVRELGTQEFARLKIGAGSPPSEFMDLADYVLSKIRDTKEIQEGLDKGETAGLMFLENAEFSKIMQKVN